MKKYKVAPEVRQQFIDRIKNEGLTVSEAAKEAGVHETTVYGWLGKQAESVRYLIRSYNFSCIAGMRLRHQMCGGVQGTASSTWHSTTKKSGLIQCATL